MGTAASLADGSVVGQAGSRRSARDVSWGLCLSSWGDGGAPPAAGRPEVFLDTVSELRLHRLT